MGGCTTDGHEALIGDLSRRDFLARTAAGGLAAVVASALPLARGLVIAAPARAAEPGFSDATLQAFADTIIPGRKTAKTDLGNTIHPLAIAGVDPLPGAVEADSLALYHHPLTGFDSLEPVFLADLSARALPHGGDFLDLPFPQRVATCIDGLAFANPTRLIWEAATAVPFTAFCAAALIPEQTAAKASGYRVMGLPGVAPNGYWDFSYRRRLSRERTRSGSLP
jgi:hypothetical protein